MTGFDAPHAIEGSRGFKGWVGGDGYDYVFGKVPQYFRITPSETDDVTPESLLSFRVTLPFGSSSLEGQEVRSYVLIAAVRERATSKEADRIRLFDREGQDVFPREYGEGYSSTDWQVGAPGHQYHLYYARTDTIYDPPSAELRERMRLHWVRRRTEEKDPDNFRNVAQRELDRELASM